MVFHGVENFEHSDRIGAGIIARMPLLFINLWIKAAGQPRIWRFRERGISGFLGEMGWVRRVGSVTQALQTSIMLVSIWTKFTLCKQLNSKSFLMSISDDIWTGLAAAS